MTAPDIAIPNIDALERAVLAWHALVVPEKPIPKLVELVGNLDVSPNRISAPYVSSLRIRFTHFHLNIGASVNGQLTLRAGVRAYRFPYSSSHRLREFPFPIVLEPGVDLVAFTPDMFGGGADFRVRLFGFPEE